MVTDAQVRVLRRRPDGRQDARGGGNGSRHERAQRAAMAHGSVSVTGASAPQLAHAARSPPSPSICAASSCCASTRCLRSSSRAAARSSISRRVRLWVAAAGRRTPPVRAESPRSREPWLFRTRRKESAATRSVRDRWTHRCCRYR